jgi:hypothetical protein
VVAVEEEEEEEEEQEEEQEEEEEQDEEEEQEEEEEQDEAGRQEGREAGRQEGRKAERKRCGPQGSSGAVLCVSTGSETKVHGPRGCPAGPGVSGFIRRGPRMDRQFPVFYSKSFRLMSQWRPSSNQHRTDLKPSIPARLARSTASAETRSAVRIRVGSS